MDKNFLQSEAWRKFQELVGRRTFHIESDSDYFNVIEHKLPIVGRYFYIPRPQIATNNLFEKIIRLAKKENVGWVRVDINNSRVLKLLKNVKILLAPPFKKGEGIRKAPHDMQPRQIFIIDISKPEEELLAEMKSKTRYNIKLSQKRGVSVKVISNTLEYHLAPDAKSTRKIKEGVDSRFRGNDKEKYIYEFLRLVKLTSERKNITSHPEKYYRQMLEIPGVKLYLAEYKGKIIAANIMSFYSDTATYLHGASDDKYRNVMAPFLLQWQAIKDAKKAGCEWYDMGGIKISNSPAYLAYRQAGRTGRQFPISNEILNFPPKADQPLAEKNENKNNNEKLKNLKFNKNLKLEIRNSSWSGITRFKLGFSPKTKPVEFLGSYDIVLSSVRYWIYRTIRIVKDFVK